MKSLLNRYEGTLITDDLNVLLQTTNNNKEVTHMKYSISELMIEVGRKCNMKCDHCLRGDAQDVEINTDYVDKLLENIRQIDSLTITGGEPFLYPDAVHRILTRIMDMNIPIGSFFIATNGTVLSMQIINDLMLLYAKCSDADMCELKISNDQFHRMYIDESDTLISDILEELVFTQKEPGYDIEDDYLIAEGRAALNTCAERKPEDRINSITVSENETFINGMIYLNALGEILINCDLSYEDQKQRNFGSIANESFDNIVLRIQKSIND